VKPDDLIEGGLLRDTDLDGEPSKLGAAELGPYGRYVLIEELGRGGAAIVYRAQDPLLNRELALKRLRFGDLELEKRFLREAELLARLSHPGIMPVFDFGREGDSLYYTMPLAPGLSLDRWIVERRPDAREAARIVRQAAVALANAHECGVLHRDVKPANILVSADGNALVADFGLGRFEDPKARALERMTEAGEVMGTPNYMAPEFALGDLKGVDARCDVYGLGATLYEALTGQPPFSGRSSLEILKRVTTEDPAPPRTLAPDTPADLEIICLKALEKDPLRRYGTSSELADDLGRFLSGEPIQARRAGPVYRLRRFVSRRRAIVSVAVAGLLIAAGVGVFAKWRADQAAARGRLVSRHLDEASRHQDAVEVLLRTAAESDPAVAEQTRLAFEEIDKALEIDPRSADAHFQKGRVHALRIETEEARRCYDRAIQFGPVVRAYLERAVLDCQDLMILKSDPASSGKERIEELRKAIREHLDAVVRIGVDPDDLNFARALLEMNRLDVAGFQSAARLLKTYASKALDWRALYWKGLAEMECGESGPARESLEGALAARPRTRVSALMLDRLAFLDLKLDQLADAERRLRLATELNPGYLAAQVNLAIVLIELGKADEAVAWCEKAIERAPSLSQAHAVRGQALVLKYDQKRAISAPEELRGFLVSAKESLETALRDYPADTEPGKELRKDLDYVNGKLGY
jgi:serine/threonine-protein kinase